MHISGFLEGAPMSPIEAKAKIWFPFYVGDYLADTGHLSTAEHGAYLLILCHQWRQGHMQEVELVAVTRMSVDAWSMSQARLKHLLSIDENGYFYSKRLDLEKDDWAAKRQRSTEKAAKAAKARWDRYKLHAPSNAPSNAPRDATGHAPAMLKPCPSPSPSQVSTSPTATPPERGAGASRSSLAIAPPDSSRRHVEDKAKQPKSAEKASMRSRMPSAREIGVSSQINNLMAQQTTPMIISAARSRLEKWLSQEVRKFMSEVGGVNISKVPWSDRDTKASAALLEASPGLYEGDLTRCLEHRSISVELGWLSATLQPSKWLRDLPSFLAGPLDGDGRPLRKGSGGTYKRR